MGNELEEWASHTTPAVLRVSVRMMQLHGCAQLDRSQALAEKNNRIRRLKLEQSESSDVTEWLLESNMKVHEEDAAVNPLRPMQRPPQGYSS